MELSEKIEAKIEARKEKNRLKRQALAKIKRERDELKDALAIVAMAREDTGPIVEALATLETNEKALTQRKDAWIQTPDGRWHRTIDLTLGWVIRAKADPAADGGVGQANLEYGEYGEASTTVHGDSVEAVIKSLNAVISGYRTIVRNHLKPTPQQGES